MHRRRPAAPARRPAGVHAGATGRDGRRDHTRAHRPPQPPRLQHAAAVVGPARRALHEPPPVAGRGDVRARRLEPGAGTGHRRRRGHAALRRGPGRGRRGHVDPGIAAGHPGLRRLDGAQHREGADRGLRQGPAAVPGRHQGRRSGTAAIRAAPRRRALVRLPPRRGHGAGAARRVRRPARRRVRAPEPHRHPLHGAHRRRLRGLGPLRRRRRRLVAVLEPLALWLDHGRPRRAPARPPRLPRLRLGTVGHEEPAGRAEGRRAVERRGARRRARRARPRDDGDRQRRRRPAPLLGRRRRAAAGRRPRRRARHDAPRRAGRRSAREPAARGRAVGAARHGRRPARPRDPLAAGCRGCDAGRGARRRRGGQGRRDAPADRAAAR